MTMYRRNCRTTDVVGDIRPSRKCFSFYGCLFALLMLLAVSTQQASCRPSHEDETLPPHFNVDEEFRDVDNLEIHHVKLVNGMLHEDHPIIMYKEDFVDEDYVPAKNSTKRPRKYKDISQRRRHRTTPTPDMETPEEFSGKTEKIYFDFIPETPLMVPEPDGAKRRKSHIKLVPLSEEVNADKEAEDTPSKDELLKRPKKFHRRVRREAGDEHVVRKRNPYFRHVPKNEVGVPQQHVQTHYIYVKHAVPGKKHNGLDIPVTKRPSKGDNNANTPISFDNRVAVDEDDRVIFATEPKTTARPRPTRRPQEESIFRDPSPENYDFSFMNPSQQARTTSRPFTRRPLATRPTESIFRDPRPENYDFSFMNQGQSSSSSASASTSRPQSSNGRRPTSGPSVQPLSTGISQCVWAIVNCCSNRDSEIRYSCFEQNGCHGAFWGLNPCAENNRDNFVNYVADYYN